MAASEEGLPRQLGRYVVVEHLATGGMGAVYLALQSTRIQGLDRPCVVKTIRTGAAASRTLVSRFLDEARTSLLLTHKNLCTTLDVDEAHGTVLLAMEHIAGKNLRDVFERVSEAAADDAGALSPEEIVAIGVEALDGLEFAHNLADPRTGQPLGLVHRDISPHNVMISFGGDVKVIDFGVARSRIQTSQTAQGNVVGKFRYMAPEQIAAGRVDRRADVFCVGEILIELLAGERFYGDIALEHIWGCWSGSEPWRSPALDKVPANLRPVLERAIEADPRQRFGSAAALKDALIAVVGPPRAGTLKRAMSRLFPGEEEAWRQHLQDLYRRAEVFVQGKTPAPASRRSVSADAPTMPRILSSPSNTPDLGGEPTERISLSDAATRVSAAPRAPAARATTTEPPTDLEPTTLTQGTHDDGGDRTIDGTAPGEGTLATSMSSASMSITQPTTASPASDGRPVAHPAGARTALGGIAAFMAAIAVLAVASAIAWTVFRDPPNDQVVDAGTARATIVVADAGSAVVDAGPALVDVDADAGATLGGIVDAGSTETDVQVDPPTTPRDRDRLRGRPRPRPTPKPDVDATPAPPLPTRPDPLGKRIDYLGKHCATRAPACTATALEKRARLSGLAPAEISNLSTNVNACLDACGAPR